MRLVFSGTRCGKFIHSCYRYLLNTYYVPVMILDAWDIFSDQFRPTALPRRNLYSGRSNELIFMEHLLCVIHVNYDTLSCLTFTIAWSDRGAILQIG